MRVMPTDEHRENRHLLLTPRSMPRRLIFYRWMLIHWILWFRRIFFIKRIYEEL